MHRLRNTGRLPAWIGTPLSSRWAGAPGGSCWWPALSLKSTPQNDDPGRASLRAAALVGSCQLTHEDPGQGLHIQRGPRRKSKAAHGGERARGRPQLRTLPLLCRHWARDLCLRTRASQEGKGPRGRQRGLPAAPEGPCPTRWTWAGPCCPGTAGACSEREVS